MLGDTSLSYNYFVDNIQRKGRVILSYKWKIETSRKHRKKRNRNPSPISSASTRSRNKADMGNRSKILGRKRDIFIREEKGHMNIMDGIQLTI